MTPLGSAMFLLAAGGFVSGATMRLAEPLLPEVAADLGVGVADAAVLITGFSLAYGLFQLVHGPLGDRHGKLRTVCVALFLAALATAACTMAADLQELAVYRFLTGMTAGAVIPLSFAFVGDNVPFAERQPVLGRFISGVLLGQAFGPLLGGVFSDHLGWRATFAVPALAFALIALALLPAAWRERVAPREGPALGVVAGYAALLRTARVRTICLAVAIEGCFFYGAFAFLGAFLRGSFALSYTAIGVVLAGFGIGGLIYSLAVKVLVRRVGVRRMVLAAGWILGACFLAVPWMPGQWTMLALVVVLGIGFYLLHNTLQTQATEMAPHARGAAISLFAFALFFGQALGVEGGAVMLVELGYASIFSAAAVGLAALAWWFARRA